MKRIVEKVLSSNDIGITGSHQAGILIPKKKELLSFFPELDVTSENPRVILHFEDTLGQIWKFNYIYYNNKLRGGTRNEYRLTSMTKYLRNEGASLGDTLIFECDDDEYFIRIRRSQDIQPQEDEGIVTLILDDSWRIINY